MLRLKLAGLFTALVLLGSVDSVRAYDLSRQDSDDSDKTERGFVELQGALWLPAFGTFETYHQMSFDFGGEVGFRFLSLRGQHNFYAVAGLSFSPQKLDPKEVPAAHSNTDLWLGYGGVRYIPSVICTSDGAGCLFFELRLGLAFEHADSASGHKGPKGDVTVLPGIGYRYRLGELFQLGARADVSYTAESGDHQLGWATLGAFVGLGW
jgi:hypothetical protein